MYPNGGCSRTARAACMTAAASTPCLLSDAESLLASSEVDFYQKQLAAAAHIARSSDELAATSEDGRDASGRVTLKCVVVGDHGVGKTSLLSRYVTDEFLGDHKPTVLDNYSVQLSVNGRPLQLSITDTAGLIDFSAIRQLSYNQVGVFLLCFSVVQPQSLSNVLDIWLPEVRKHCPNTPILLIGTQADMRSDLNVFRQLMEREEQPVWPERGRKWVKVLKLAGYFECSAKTSKGMKEVFDEAVAIGLRRHRQTKGWLPEKGSRQVVERRYSGSISDEDARQVNCLGPVGSSVRQRGAARLVSSATTSSSDSGASVFSNTSDGSGYSDRRGSLRQSYGGVGVVRKIAKIFSRT